MSDLLTLTRDARLSPYATSAAAAWLWAADGSRVLWANAAGAALSAGHDFGAQVVQIAATLPARAAARTERLTVAHGDALACACSRVALGDTPAILIVADAPVQPVMPLAERAARLFGASPVPLLVFSGMGTLLFASPQAEDKIGSTATLAALGAGALMAQAIADGHAAGRSAIGPLTIQRMGSGGATVLVATFGEEAAPNTASILDETEFEDPEFEAGQDTVAEPEPVTLADVGTALQTLPEPPPAAEPPPPPTTVDEDILAPADPADMLPAEAAAPLAPPEPTLEPATPEPTAAAPERRYPLRFVWTMDADERFTLASGDFTEVAGARTGALMGQPWGEIASALALDPEGRVAHAVESRDTWSGITLAWPLDGVGERIGVELSGLPIFDRDRSFRGYRGFGVCREITRDTATMPAPHIEPPPATEPPRTEPEHDTLAAPAEPRPALTVVPAAKNVVPFRAATLVPDKRTALTPVERTAFREIGETLAAPERGSAAPERGSAAPERREPEETHADTAPLPSAFATGLDVDHDAATETEALAVLDRLPVGILIHHGEQLIYANRAFLEWSGYADIHALAEDGGLERLVIEPGAPLDRANGTGKAFNIETRTGETLACEGRLYTVPWEGESALMLVLVRGVMDGRTQSAELALRQAEAETRELHQVLDTAADGVVVLDRDGRVLTFNRAAEALFGYGYHEVARRPFVELFAPDSEDAARDHLAATIENGAAAPNDGHEVTGRTRAGRPIPLFMTMGRIGALNEKVCAVFRDISPWKRTEDDLVNARRNAENASSAKSEFLAKISHEIRTPLNSIIGFSEAMIEERFGAIGNERYREYLNDIHTSGGHIVSLINDLLDLSKIEAGKLDLVFASVNLNQLVQQCVALMQPQANQSRIIIRSSLSPSLPNVTADARSVRQIALNLLSNAIKFTGAGGQVIVSTGATERGEVALRVRDTGAGMTAKELETAMEPFRQLPTSGRESQEGTGLGLPLTKALAEANRARFSIESEKDAGTLVEITFGGGARVDP
jgi:PAS domain S-box-containing protein